MRQFLNLLKAFWIAYVWDPFMGAWNTLVGYHFCCENPDWEWQEVPGFTIRRCKNCGDTQTNFHER